MYFYNIYVGFDNRGAIPNLIRIFNCEHIVIYSSIFNHLIIEMQQCPNSPQKGHHFCSL